MPRRPSLPPTVWKPAPVPVVWKPAPPPAVQPTLGQTIKEGFGLGIGVAAGQRVVGAVLGPAPAPAPTGKRPDELWQLCLERTNFDVEKCEVFKPAASS
jgi:hypothetical protein